MSTSTKATNAGQGLLQQELEFYGKNRDRFLKEHTNRYLLIKEEKLIASYLTSDQAIWGRGSAVWLRAFSREDVRY